YFFLAHLLSLRVTLFPYTTLFRSLRGDQMDAVMNYDLSIPMWQYFENKISISEFKNEITNYTAMTPKNVMENMFNQLDTHDTVRDRKSTRLNSSHVKISYAVFCLK